MINAILWTITTCCCVLVSVITCYSLTWLHSTVRHAKSRSKLTDLLRAIESAESRLALIGYDIDEARRTALREGVRTS